MTRIWSPVMGVSIWVPDAWSGWTFNGIEYRRHSGRVQWRAFGAHEWQSIARAGVRLDPNALHPAHVAPGACA